jgi:hypothetical protein
MATTFYLKKEKDSIVDGNELYNSLNSLSIDINFRDISLGKARRKHEFKKQIGNGQKIIRSVFRNPQDIKGRIKYNSLTANTFDSVRREFLRDWVHTEDVVYLYRNEDDRLTKREVILDIDGNESYDLYRISNDISVILLSEKPFFTNVVEVVENFTKTGATEEIPITNNGEYVPFIVNFTFGSGAGQFIVKTFENKAVEIDYSFSNGMVLQIDLADLTIYINGIERTNLDVTGSPFNLVPGNNTVKIISAAPGTGNITYSERYT